MCDCGPRGLKTKSHRPGWTKTQRSFCLCFLVLGLKLCSPANPKILLGCFFTPRGTGNTALKQLPIVTKMLVISPRVKTTFNKISTGLVGHTTWPKVNALPPRVCLGQQQSQFLPSLVVTDMPSSLLVLPALLLPFSTPFPSRLP